MFRWKKPLIIVSTIAFIVSVIVSLFITDMYKSTVTMFPKAISSISRPLIGSTPYKDDILKFGEKEEAETLMQILKSDKIRNQTVKNLNLISYYEIDTLQPKWKAKLIEVFQGNITFNITKFSAVEIEVLDKSPEMAAKIANEIAKLVDVTIIEMQKETSQQAFFLVQKKHDDQVNYVNSLQDSLKTYMELGIIEYESQVERYTEQLSIAILQGKTSAIESLEKKLSVFAKYGSRFTKFRDLLAYENKQLAFLKSKLEEVQLDANNLLSYKFVLDYATPADKKHTPKRMLIVLISVMSAFLLTFVFLLIKDSISNLTNLNQD
ncbi:MAG: hypothetical protein RQ875_01675 [Vicingaceae bacterium]|nr:hypothetical protein [Vicingaceae bacterium]